MADITVWNGRAEFTAGESTPFGFYDDDISFQEDAPKVALYCAQKLGWPVLDVELNEKNFFTAFEEAVTAYGKEVIEAIAAENMGSTEGAGTNTFSVNSTVFSPNLQQVIRLSKQYGMEAGVGGDVDLKYSLIPLREDQQEYDLQEIINSGSIEIRRVFYQAPPAILKYFDPFAGTGTGVQSLMDAFDFGSYSPGINFLMMPASYDVLKMQAIEFNDQIRKSAYSFEVHNNKLRIFPIPKGDGVVRVEYYRQADKSNSFIANTGQSDLIAFNEGTVTGTGGTTSTTGIVTNLSNVNTRNLKYSEINSIGRQWIYKYAAAISKEMLAYVRGKYQTVPVPGSEVSLNSQELLTDAREEQKFLIQGLKDTLQVASLTKQLEMKAQQSKHINDTLQGIPMFIYVG